MTHHKYAACEDPVCQLCDDYSAGYVDGKSRALFEGSTQTADHAACCGCGPCLAVKERLRCRAALQERLDPDVPPAQDSEHGRGGLTAGLQAELALLLGIELSDGVPLLNWWRWSALCSPAESVRQWWREETMNPTRFPYPVGCPECGRAIPAETEALMGADYWRHLEKEHGMTRSIAVRHDRSGTTPGNVR